MQKQLWKKMAVGMLLIGMLSGCAKEETPSTVVVNGKGRYVEEEITLPDSCDWTSPLFSLKTGALNYIQIENATVMESDLEVRSFQKKDCPWMEGMNIYYVSNYAVSKEGKVFMTYVEKEGEDDRAVFVDEQGNKRETAWEDKELMSMMSLDFFGEDRLIGTRYGGSVYEIDPQTGTKKELFSGSDGFGGFAVTDTKIIAINEKNFYIYDLVNETLEENPKAVTDFLMEQKSERGFQGTGDISYCFAEDKEGAILILNSEGLYRYVPGGSRVEQLIDGRICSLSNPSCHLKSLIALEDDSFVVFFSEGKMVRYRFDEEASVTPNKEIRIFSLKENKTIQQAVSLYQSKYPDRVVDYQIGMKNGESVTEEEVIRSLNTKLLSKEPMDILVLDQLPTKNYLKEGVLIDLMPYWDRIDPEKQLYPNLSSAYDKDGKRYAVPAKYRLQVLLAPKEKTQDIKDFVSLSEVICSLKKEDKMAAGLIFPEQILHLMLRMEKDNILKEDGVNRVALEEALNAAKNIYDAEKREDVDEEGFEGYFLNASMNCIGILMDDTEMTIGLSSGFLSDMFLLSTVETEKPSMDLQYGIGENKDMFLASCCVGITKNSQKIQESVDFLEVLMSASVQEIELEGEGYPVNKKAAETIQENYKARPEGGGVSYAIGDNRTGEMFSFTEEYPGEEQLQEFNSMLEGLKRPYEEEIGIENIVLEIGKSALLGNCSVNEAAEEIADRLTIYLKE